MSDFKFKPDKVKYIDHNDTIENLHKNTMEKFNKNNEQFNKWVEMVQTYKETLNNITFKYCSDNNLNYIDERCKILDKIDELEHNIEQNKDCKSEMNYLYNTNQTLYDYFDIVDAFKLPIETNNNNNNNNNNNTNNNTNNNDNNNNTNNNNNNTNNNDNNNNNTNNNNNNNDTNNNNNNNDTNNDTNNENTNQTNNDKGVMFIDNIGLFGNNNGELSALEKLHQLSKQNRKEKKTSRKRIRDMDSFMKENNNNSIFQYINDGKITTGPNRAQLYKDYLTSLYGYKQQKTILKICPTCNIEKVQIYSDGIYVCTECGECDNGIIESEANNYKDPIIEKPTFPYKRKNHFCEWLSQFQAKESSEIPDEVIQKIRKELDKMHYTNKKINDTKISKFKNILRTLKLNAYYNHVPHIKSKLTGIPAPALSRDAETEFKNMFDLIQAPYEKHKPKSRVNFLSYAYVLNKFCCIKKLDHYKDYFPLLKNKQKKLNHDSIWFKICQDLSWSFNASE